MTYAGKYGAVVIMVVLLASIASAQGIHDAVLKGDIDLVRDLITADDSLVNAANEKGMTPLRLAVYTGNIEITKLLLDKGAATDDIHPMYGSIINQAFTAACQKGGGTELVELLIDRGLSFDAGQVDALGMSPLDWAVHFGNVPMARLAIGHNADVNLISPRLGRTPLVAAVSKGHEELAAILLENGADVSIVDKHGNPPVFYAVEQGRTSILRGLLDHGATTDYIEPHYGRSLIHIAAIKGFLDITQRLVESGGDLEAVDGAGLTPLDYAAGYGNRKVSDYLIEQGTSRPNKPVDKYTKSPQLSEDYDSDNAAVRYLNNRGWAVGTNSRWLVFDAEEFGVRRSDNPCLANGFLTAEELKQQQVIGLYSCYHGLPGEPAYIHTLADSLENMAFIHLVDDAWRGSLNTTYLEGGADTTIAGIKVQTIDIADYMPMLAYMCHVEGMAIYYQAFGTDDPEKLRQNYEFLGRFTDTVDIAFLPLPDSGQAEPDVRLFLERFPTRSLVLLDSSRREYMFPDAARLISGWGYKMEVFCAENPGDRFDYSVWK